LANFGKTVSPRPAIRRDLPDWPAGPIRCTDGQAAVFKSLWSFKGEPVAAERVMQRADPDSDKPIDVFKVKARDKDKPEAEGPLAAHLALVVTQTGQGLYSMPEAATATTASVRCADHPSAMGNRRQ
jgi:hypothetical protein